MELVWLLPSSFLGFFVQFVRYLFWILNCENFKYLQYCKLSMTQKMKKRIPVSEEVWKELGKEKEAGETYNDLIKKMIKDHNKQKLMKKMKKVEKMDKEELVSLDEL